MKLSLILCIICESVAFVCICYGIICFYRSYKKSKEQVEKERIATHLYLSTTWLIWAEFWGVKVSNISSANESKYGFHIIFAKQSSDRIETLLGDCGIADVLKGHFEKFESGRYGFINYSLDEAQSDIERLMQYCTMVTSYSSKLSGNGGIECQTNRIQ